jgi:hypothetical protein
VEDVPDDPETDEIPLPAEGSAEGPVPVANTTEAHT